MWRKGRSNGSEMPTEADTRWAIDRISKLTLSITVTGDDHQILFGFSSLSGDTKRAVAMVIC